MAEEKVEEKAEEKKDGIRAKDVSLGMMVTASIWIGALSLTKAFWPLFSDKPFGLTMYEIILSGLVIAGVFCPVFFSIFLDKIKEIKTA